MGNHMHELIQQAQRQLELGHVDQAQELLAQAAQEAANDQERGEAALEHGKLYLLLGQLKPAADLCHQAVELLPENPKAYYYLGRVYRQQEKWEEALEAFEQADRLQPNDPAILANRGRMLFHHTQAQDGKPLVIRALRLDLTRHETLLDLAYIYIAEGNLTAATACVMRAYQLGQGDQQAEEMLDIIQRLRHRFDDGTETDTARRAIPQSKEQWRRWIATVSSPMELVTSLTQQANPKSEKEFQSLINRALTEWNQAPRPELGGLSPEKAGKEPQKPSVVEDVASYPWLRLDNRQAENNTVRCDMVAFLTHLRDSKYKATASLGNLPLKAVRAVNDLLTHPVPLEHKVGDEVISQVRLVSEVWPIFFLQGIAMLGEMAVFEPGKWITLTEAGLDFLRAAPTCQIWTILYTWWWVTDWRMAYQWEVFDDMERAGLPIVTLRLLRSMPVGRQIKVDDFIEALTELTGMTAQGRVAPARESLLKGAVNQMILNVLADFEIITLNKKQKKLYDMRFEETVSFRVTPFGDELLRAL
jgi:tetratricopeptide (TPR) repeat protein